MKEKISNSQMKDTSSKLIFSDPILCAQFLRGYVDIPLLKDVTETDIQKLLTVLHNLGCPRETAIEQLMEQYQLAYEIATAKTGDLWEKT